MGTKASIKCPNCGAVVENENQKECPRCGYIGVWKLDVKEGKSKSDAAKEGIDGKSRKGKSREGPLPELDLVSLRPFRETLPEDVKFTEASPSCDNELVTEYIKPYMEDQKEPPQLRIGSRLQIKEIDFEVVACKPPTGIVTNSTTYCVPYPPLTALNEIKRMHVLPIKASLDTGSPNEAKLFENNIKPFFTQEERHVRQGQTFTSNGVQFHIRQCEPEDGRVTRETTIYSRGKPIEDLKKVHMLPIFESLPNREKKIDAKTIFEKYLRPFFSGRQVFLKRDMDVKIDGVDFKVVAADPNEGIVTNGTELYAGGSPIKADEIKTRQMRSDEEMARRLQQQESGGAFFNPRSRTSPEYIRMQLRNTLRTLPPNDPNRALVQQLHNQLAMLPYVPPSSLNQSLSQLLRQQPVQQGVPPQTISSLPVRKFKADGKKDQKFRKCMICLEEYEDGQELRTLPCFHFYHKECIDKWLQMNTKCPLCKNPVA
mmetsp:Transcript_13245/g.19792  ORF Transcript_13245/g.19792 Transcript_13245/m.19792 type:complete len:485 (-) Transcript_13245:271-1725(-)